MKLKLQIKETNYGFRVFENGYKIPLIFKTKQEAEQFIECRKNNKSIDITEALFPKGVKII